MIKGLAVVVALLTALAGRAHAAPDAADAIISEEGCATNSAIAGPCFDVQGRAAIRNGIPRFQIEEGGRIFEVVPPDREIVPACLKAVPPLSDVTGRFRLCPLNVPRKDHAQIVCIERVGKFTVRRWDDEKGTYVDGGQSRGCSLPKLALDAHWHDGAPADVIDLVERYGACTHWGGEEAYDKQRRKEIEQGVERLKCDQLDGDKRRLRAKYARKRRVLRVLDAASTYDP